MSTQNKTELFNMALSAMGHRNSLMTSDSESSTRGDELNLWYPTIRDIVLRGAYWPCAKAYNRLSLINTRTSTADWVSDDPEPGWKYVYGVPNDMLRPRYFTTGERFVTGLAQTGSGEVKGIHSSAQTPVLVYTKQQDNLALWDPDLYIAVAHALGSVAGPRLRGNRSSIQRAREHANQLILTAQVAAANEDQDQIDHLAEWHQARGYGESPTINYYTYPFGPLVGATSGGESAR